MPFLLTVVPHRESWSSAFEMEATQINAALGPALKALHHIGSTSIPGIYAKPIIDMLAEVISLEAIDALQPEIELLGYEAMGEFGISGRRYFRKNSSDGNRTHQIHAFASGSSDLVRHLAFRDYLRRHPDIAREYSDLKRRLVESCNGDIEAYMDGKDGFIKETERAALAWMGKSTSLSSPSA